LKNEIARKISKIEGITSINVDDKFIINENEKRKPDVYCKYFDKHLVFEIQLSDLSLRYILNRYEFYKRNKMYLIWILDDFDIHGQNQTERDIKYLTEFQNFFKLDEKANDFKLICTYKYPFLTDRNKLLTKWIDKSINIKQLKFSEDIYQVYYFDFEKKKELKEKEKTQIELKQKEEEKKQIELQRIHNTNEETEEIVNELRELWIKEAFVFHSIKEQIRELDEFELSILNNSGAFKQQNGKPKIHKWFEIAKKDNFHFLEFMLDCHHIDIDINEKSITNKSLIQVLFENEYLENKMWLTRMFIKKRL